MIEQPRGMTSEAWVAELLKRAKEVADGIAQSEHEEGGFPAMYLEFVSEIESLMKHPVVNDRGIKQHCEPGGMMLQVWVDHEAGAHCAREIPYPKDFFNEQHWSGNGRNASHLTPTQSIGDDIEMIVTEFGEQYGTVEIRMVFTANPDDQRKQMPDGSLR